MQILCNCKLSSTIHSYLLFLSSSSLTHYHKKAFFVYSRTMHRITDMKGYCAARAGIYVKYFSKKRINYLFQNQEKREKMKTKIETLKNKQISKQKKQTNR